MWLLRILFIISLPPELIESIILDEATAMKTIEIYSNIAYCDSFSFSLMNVARIKNLNEIGQNIWDGIS